MKLISHTKLTRKLSEFQASTTRNGRIGSIGSGSNIREGISHHIDSIRSGTIAKRHRRLGQGIFSMENASAKFGMLDTVGGSGTCQTDAINTQKVHGAVGIDLGHRRNQGIQAIRIGIGTSGVLEATVSLFLTNANVVILTGQVGLSGGIGKVEGLNSAGQALVVLKASGVGSVVGRTGDLSGFDFPHPGSGGPSESESHSGGGG